MSVQARALWVAMWADALLCFPNRHLARWTAVVVDRIDGHEHPMPAVRFRWHRSVDTWIERATAKWLSRGHAVTIVARALSG